VSDTHADRSLLVEPSLSATLLPRASRPTLDCQLSCATFGAVILSSGKVPPSKEKASVTEADEVLPAVSVIRRLKPALEATLQQSTVSAAQYVASDDESPMRNFEVRVDSCMRVGLGIR